MSLRSRLDEFYLRGFRDAMAYRLPDPMMTDSRDDGYWRMAYTAGHQAGETERGRIEREQYLAGRRAAVSGDGNQ